jgi:nucleotide-binding universal stress UspA family protein
MTDGFRKILCPIDFSENCDRAAEHAAWFARTSNGEVYLVHVVANPAEPIYCPQDVTYWALVKHAEEKAAELLQQVAARCLPADCPRRTLVLDGDPYQKLMEAAESIGADLIVMATHGRSGLAHVLLGGTTEKIVRHAPCPVFIVRRAHNGGAGG